MDKDEQFLDALDAELHDAWINGKITNEFRNHMVDVLTNVREWL